MYVECHLDVKEDENKEKVFAFSIWLLVVFRKAILGGKVWGGAGDRVELQRSQACAGNGLQGCCHMLLLALRATRALPSLSLAHTRHVPVKQQHLLRVL